MFTKPLKTDVHNRLIILKKRKPLSVEQQKILERLNSGHEGETRFHHMLQTQLRCDPIQLYNLHLNVNGSECQIDCLLIFQNELILLEIKNYQGDFFIKNNKWYTLSEKAIKNPLHQLQRTELLLSQLFWNNQITLPIRPYLVFIHPEFQLYQAPLNLPLVFPNQLKRFIKKLQNIPSDTSQSHHDIATLLKNKHINSSAYESKLSYTLEEMEKGITCEKCKGFMAYYSKKYMQCNKCMYIENFKKALIRNINDFRILFPNQRLTLKTIYEWTGHHASKHRIRTILNENYLLAGQGRNMYYY